jgi:hypothetical protein
MTKLLGAFSHPNELSRTGKAGVNPHIERPSTMRVDPDGAADRTLSVGDVLQI